MTKLASVVLSNSAQSITLPVYGGSPTDMYILTGADGLGPPETNIHLGESVYRGSVYQGSSTQDREVVLLIGLNPRYALPSDLSVDAMRAEFYKFIAGSETLKITFNITAGSATDFVASTMETTGYIRRIEISPFSKTPQIQLTIACPFPFFSSPGFTNLSFPGTATPGSFIFDYYGTAITGFEMSFAITSAPTSIKLKSTANTGQSRTLVIPGTRVSGETFTIDTRPTSRRVYWTNPAIGSAYGDITGMCTVTPDQWPAVHPGHNTIQVLNQLDAVMSVIFTRMRYTNRYWGI